MFVEEWVVITFPSPVTGNRKHYVLAHEISSSFNVRVRIGRYNFALILSLAGHPRD